MDISSLGHLFPPESHRVRIRHIKVQLFLGSPRALVFARLARFANDGFGFTNLHTVSIHTVNRPFYLMREPNREVSIDQILNMAPYRIDTRELNIYHNHVPCFKGSFRLPDQIEEMVLRRSL
jgi:hypothetical protein